MPLAAEQGLGVVGRVGVRVAAQRPAQGPDAGSQPDTQLVQ